MWPESRLVDLNTYCWPTDRNYSTRRIRRQVCSRDLAAVQEKQITIPVIVPWALEDYLLSTLPQQYGDLPSHFTNFKPLIPVHDGSKYDPSTAILPSLQDTASESGNLRCTLSFLSKNSYPDLILSTETCVLAMFAPQTCLGARLSCSKEKC